MYVCIIFNSKNFILKDNNNHNNYNNYQYTEQSATVI